MRSLIPESELKLLKEFWYYFSQNRGAVLGLGLLGISLFFAVFSGVLSPFSPSELFSESLRAPPFWKVGHLPQFLLGTDDLGRDVLSRLLQGARLSLSIGLLVVVFSTVSGVFLGLLAGFYGSWIDALIMRAMDILMALPSLLLAIVVVTVLGPGLFNSVIAVSIVSVPGFVRLVRASVLSEKAKPHVMASKSFGASNLRLMFINLLPNCMSPVIVQASFSFSDGILNVAALGFLGLGAQPPTAEWGTMLADSRAYIESAPWLVTLPGVCILIVVLAFNLLGDGLRDALDPKLKK